MALAALVSLVAWGCGTPSRDLPPGAVLRSAVYVSSGLSDEVLVFDAQTGEALRSISVDRRPTEIDEAHALARSPTGQHWYVTLSHGEPTLWKFESAGDRLVGRLSLGTVGAARIGITPDGRTAFIPDYDRGRDVVGRVAIVDLETLGVLASPRVCPAPHHAEVDPGGRLVAVACSLSDEIAILDAASHRIVRRFPVGAPPGTDGTSGSKPLNLAWSPDGSALYATLHTAGEVRAFTSDGKRLGSVTVGPGPAQIRVTPGGDYLAIANRGDRSLSLVAALDLTEEARVDLGCEHPHGLAIDDSGRTAFVTCEGTSETPGRLVAVDLEGRRLLWDAPAGGYPLGAMYMRGSATRDE